ncbi:MADF domain-containing protein [Aphis craccivora]|uniref:MADF domain-containing protein n=1 Tax=Aphis craccivora TaxID=307492 RepID=A0A6G0WQD1_APHCR|nr:MADF domain-containing protein [Aphis craccivora]
MTLPHYSQVPTVNMSSEHSEEESEINFFNLTSEIDPVLWDKTLDKFSDRNEKRKAWREVFGLIKPGFEHLQSKDQKLIDSERSDECIDFTMIVRKNSKKVTEKQEFLLKTSFRPNRFFYMVVIQKLITCR